MDIIYVLCDIREANIINKSTEFSIMVCLTFPRKI